MPNVDLTEMDLAVIECLHGLRLNGRAGVQPGDLVSCIQQRFPDNDEVVMREGESITRLRGRELLQVDSAGHLTLTSAGRQMAEASRSTEVRTRPRRTDAHTGSSLGRDESTSPCGTSGPGMCTVRLVR